MYINYNQILIKEYHEYGTINIISLKYINIIMQYMGKNLKKIVKK